MTKYVGVFLAVVGLLAACQREIENPLRDPGRFAEVYAAMRFAAQDEPQPAVGEPAATIHGNTRVDSVLAAHHLKREQLEDAVSYFSEDPQRWQEVFQKVIHQLDSLSRRSDRNLSRRLPVD